MSGPLQAVFQRFHRLAQLLQIQKAGFQLFSGRVLVRAVFQAQRLDLRRRTADGPAEGLHRPQGGGEGLRRRGRLDRKSVV